MLQKTFEKLVAMGTFEELWASRQPDYPLVMKLERSKMSDYRVEFNGRLYKLRLIDFGEDWGTYYVASIQLERMLWSDECGYASDEARIVDELIFFFIETHWFKLSDEELRDMILPNL